ncbi:MULTISPECIES: 5-methyltetrahydropteroyltriglutamate--homocysteine S-methyltransferase [Brachybacterium]|uniref:5-methyltetrahydropteroyltriglutamate--homocysteine S-methyltransferase n=1 Tax=Brachybacterium tyrofermentans TaxID=47848 RepID=A0ABW0FD63_9MICO|nr:MULTISPECIES: 5-methyltetrahydropteroyltriglutamate--homocysteine S-methyltransferase [Brachybacterium]PCC35355.1 5-methyltetrahydropteroyltriglutamate--homocysteine S-methyltransferase [Brachybacterium alimentarium]RCS64931.1 5-methyltetrahydropteroyltriglutamate--homocysteine S-methyltransferase [Brachybacterium alimentarium]RCS65148.1 5-methyltetrahydropteroyltriglutamate--homocysteine S-methyltransferase [Brachybacterium sp. JB7]RCS77437.1 5-methyltetrahydropteroyltriglutamate--homocyste
MTAQTTPLPAATPVGYPRIGPGRELKKAEEAYWAGRIDHAEFARRTRELRRATRARLAELGLSAAAAAPESFSLYDQVLDAALAVGLVPDRFASVIGADGTVDDDGYFALARGTAEQPPLEMTKWFDTNYHYLVPEIGPDTDLHLASARVVDLFRESLEDGAGTRPVLVGPLTLLLLAKAQDGAPEGFDPLERLDDVVGVYAQLLAQLAAAGAPWVQLDEPALAADQRLSATELADALQRSVGRLAEGADRPQLLVTTPYGGIGDLLPALLATGVEAAHIDLTRGDLPTTDQLAGIGSTQLVAGLVEGRSVWRTELPTAAARLAELRSRVAEAGGAADTISVSTSVSLQHVPHTLELETSLAAELVATLAFADEKIAEIVTLAGGQVEAGSVDGPRSVPRTFDGVRVDSVRERVAAAGPADTERDEYAVRAEAQRRTLGLPDLPTTTIGSFPQVGEVRAARAAHRRGTLDDAGYEQAMKDEIARVITLQEEIGLDVLVHGEPERNDMVQYFAENLEGFATTEHGWVQSYGSRCTRPSILFGDVHRPAPITVGWSTYAQSLTPHPVKGMLTGPVTILAWSFVRDDQPLGDTAAQVGLALRDEVTDLEAAGIRIVQVDEPALRELLPLRTAEHDDYLDWSVRSFRLATSGVEAATQIHTHLCYSEFNVVVGAIDALNADVTSIESARSRGEILEAIDPGAFPRGIGPGVWDIHSPRVPGAEEIADQLRRARAAVGPERLWVNPDCGLKTRGYAETEASLRHLVQATREVRAEVEAPAAL